MPPVNVPQFTAAQMIDALRQARGIKAAAARALGCERITVVRYCQKYPSVQAACDEQRERLVDVAESHLTKWVEQGQERAVFWALATLGKDRGYVLRQEQTGKDGEAIAHELTHRGGVEVRAVDYRHSIRLLAAPSGEQDGNGNGNGEGEPAA